MELQECVEPEGVIVETVSKLEGNTHVLERGRESLPEPFRPGEASADTRLKRRMRRCFAQGLRKNRNGEVVVLELGEKKEGLRTQWADLGLVEQLGRDRARARPLPGSEMGTSGCQRSTVVFLARFERREPKGVLGELGRGRRRAAVGRDHGGIVEDSGDIGVRGVRREREMTCAL